MGFFQDFHLIIMVIVFIYLTGRIQNAGVRSRSMSAVVAGFIVFFIFYQHVILAFLLFFGMFFYYFAEGVIDGYAEGKLMDEYVNAFNNPNPNTSLLIQPMGPKTEKMGSKG